MHNTKKVLLKIALSGVVMLGVSGVIPMVASAVDVGGKCDANYDGSITMADLLVIRAANNQPASGPSDPRDANSDGVINVADVRYCQLRLGQ